MTRVKSTQDCSLEGCDNPAIKRGWCNMHYQRWRRNGDPLAGGTFVGEPQRFFFDVVLPFQGDECLTWLYERNNGGYGKIWRKGRHHVVSRIVCEARYGPSPTPEHEVAHSCGKGHEGCVNPRHLRWATPKENEADKLAHGTHNRGERSSSSKLTEKDVREIRMLRGQKLQREIAEQFGVARSQISMIQSGMCWGWLI